MSYDDLRWLGVTFRPIDCWPGPLNPDRRRSPFYATFSQTIETLARELRALDAERVVFQIACQESDLRLDGMPRANTRTGHPGVVLAFGSKYGPLQYATDEFWTWQENLRGIALAMEALRKVDRYGVSKRGEQYQGWKALPVSTDPAASIQTEEQARAFLDEHGGSFTEAAKRLHPDMPDGDPDEFRKAVRARELLGGRS